MVLVKKWGILLKEESGNLVFIDLEIPRDLQNF